MKIWLWGQIALVRHAIFFFTKRAVIIRQPSQLCVLMLCRCFKPVLRLDTTWRRCEADFIRLVICDHNAFILLICSFEGFVQISIQHKEQGISWGKNVLEKEKFLPSQPPERIELSTPGLQDQCSNHWAMEASSLQPEILKSIPCTKSFALFCSQGLKDLIIPPK